MRLFESGLSLFSLAGFIWVVIFLLPKARRGRDAFALICSLLTAIIMLLGFLFIGTQAISR